MVVVPIFSPKVFHNPKTAHKLTEDPISEILRLSSGCYFTAPFNYSFDVDVSSIPRRCGFAYFVDSADIDHYNEQRAICKFQKADLIYKQILSIYSENAGNVSGLKFGDDSSKIIFFQPVSGGVGASSMAAACAIHFASKRKKTLYLNLEKFGSANVLLL